MPPVFMKPEAILRRSEDLLALNTPQSTQQALDSLMEVFQSKRFKQTPLATLDPILARFLNLCLTLRKPRLARDALSLYKIAAQQVSIPSIENVVREFLKNCEARLKEAEEEMKTVLGDATGDEVKKEEAAEDDLELPLQPTTLLMDSLLGEGDAAALALASGASVDAALATKDKERVERTIVLPWLKFTWEAYKSALDITKSNSRLEGLYQSIALQAFGFCKSHSRRSEFRRLCEQLRKDVINAQKYSHQNFGINFSEPETLSRHLDTRFAQLETAVEMELWQEAFRSVEDIHSLLVNPAAKKATKPAMMANYYEKLTRIFNAEGGANSGAAAGSTMAVFHAAAWARYLQFAEREKERKEEKGGASAAAAASTSNEKANACVLLSALAVPLLTAPEDSRNTHRLVALLNLSKMPTRAGLIKDVLAKNILRRVPSDLRELYNLVEVDFHPLTIAASIAPIVERLAKDAEYAPYVRGLRQVVLSRLFASLSELYSTLTIEHVIELVAPFQSGPWQITPAFLESFLVTASKQGSLGITIDHVAKAITFNNENEDAAATTKTTSSAEGKPTSLAELTNLSAIAADIANTGGSSQLARLAAALQNTIYYLNPEVALAAAAARKEALLTAVSAAEDERKAAQHRQAIVARRRQKLEEIRSRREKEQASARAERDRLAAQQAQEREAQLFLERERERVQKEIDAIRSVEAKKLAETLKARGALKIDMDNIESLDTDHLLQLQAKQIEKEQKETLERTRIIAKRVDHLERALRKEERPLIEADYERQKEADRVAHNAAILAQRQAATEKHQHDLALKQRLGRMMADYSKVRAVVESKRVEEFAAKRSAADKKIAEEKAKLKKKVLAERAEEEARKEQQRIAEEKAQQEEAGECTVFLQRAGKISIYVSTPYVTALLIMFH